MNRRTYGVYVIELEGEPNAVYVGSTVKPFEERMAQHNEGGRLAARIFRNGARAARLREDIHGKLPRFDERQRARRAERRLANQLAHRGFNVTVGI